MAIVYTKSFIRNFQALPIEIQERAVAAEKLFRTDNFHPRLHTHKLRGAFAGQWSLWVDYRYRIIFEFYDIGTIYFLAIGTHKIYQ